MARTLLVSCRRDGRRVALLEDGVTSELFFEKRSQAAVVGSVYKGRVVRVLPGMQAAFVEIGLARTAFLFVGDIASVRAAAREPQPTGADDAAATSAEPAQSVGRGERYPPIATLLRGGQEILVQLTKEPMGTKGARLTTQLSFPGRYLVFTPDDEHLGVSRRIEAPAERDRLREIIEGLDSESGGIIVRTAAEGQPAESLADDLAFLRRHASLVLKKSEVATSPALISRDLDVTLRSVRDLMTDATDRIMVDDEEEARHIRRFLDEYMPDFRGKLEVWLGPEPMFSRFGLDWEISRAMRRKVWLRSGGYVIIDHTEALTVIDVNSGRNVGTNSLEETLYGTNVEAVAEIAYQLRLRDIGGIIVVDFIDMELEAHRAHVYEALLEALKRDKARTRVLPISEFGLVEMTRKRVREPIVSALTEECLYCEGRGFLRSSAIIAEGVLMRLRQQLTKTEPRDITVRANPKVALILSDELAEDVAAIEQWIDSTVTVIADPSLHLERFVVE